MSGLAELNSILPARKSDSENHRFGPTPRVGPLPREREFFIDNLLI